MHIESSTNYVEMKAYPCQITQDLMKKRRAANYYQVYIKCLGTEQLRRPFTP